MHERWDGVPFIFNAGKALDEQKVEVVIKFKETPGACQMFGCDTVPRNELVMELEPKTMLGLGLGLALSSEVSMRLQCRVRLIFHTRVSFLVPTHQIHMYDSCWRYYEVNKQHLFGVMSC
jgi:glucose-6-phosphate 1-dehydrogenase